MLTWHKVFTSEWLWRYKCGHCYSMYGIKAISNLAETISGLQQFSGRHGGWVVSVLDSRLEGLGSSPCRVIVLCSWASHSMPLSTQVYKWVVLCSWASHSMPLFTQVYKWLPANCQSTLTDFWEVTYDGLASHPGGVDILYSSIHATKTGISLGCVGRWFGLLIFFSLNNFSNCRFGERKLGTSVGFRTQW